MSSQQYTFVPLDLSGATNVFVTGINASGEIVGWYTESSGQQHGFIDIAGNLTTIDPPGSDHTNVVAIDGGGEIVGDYLDSAGQQHGFIANAGTITTIDLPGAITTNIIAIDDQGETVGTYVDSAGQQHGFLDIAGTITTVDPPDSVHTNIVEVVGFGGGIVGNYLDGTGQQHGFIDVAGTITIIDPPGSTSTNITAAAGEIVGTYDDSVGQQHGFADNAGTITTIDPPGSTSTNITTISASSNASQEIVGTYVDGVGQQHGFVDIAGSITTIDPSGSTNTNIAGINSVDTSSQTGVTVGGEIIGTYQDSAGEQHGFVDNAGTITAIDPPGSGSANIVAINVIGEIAGYYENDLGATVSFAGLPQDIVAQMSTQQYSFTTTPSSFVDPPDSTYTNVIAINDSDEIVGTYLDSNGQQHGFIDSAGSITSFDPPDSTYTNVIEVNDSDEMVGTYLDSNGQQHGFVDYAGTITSFDPPDSTYTNVNALNDAGEIVGDYQDSVGQQRGFIDSAGTITSFDPAGSTSTHVVTVNDAGEIAGDYQDSAGQQHGFIDSAGTIISFDPPGSTSTHVLTVNDGDEIVGTYLDSNGQQHGYIDNSGTITLVDPPDSTYSNVIAVDDSDEIVGTYLDSNGQQHGFIDNAGTMTSFDPPDSTYTNVSAISDGGEIVGDYLDSTGQQHGFIDNAGAITTVDPPGSTGTDAIGINASGEIVEIYDDDSGQQRVFFTNAGAVGIATTATIEVPNAPQTYVIAINDSGELAGYYDDGTEWPHGFVDNAGTITTIDPPGSSNGRGSTNTRVTGINASGDVFGTYNGSSSFAYIAGTYTAIDDPGMPSNGPRVVTNDLGETAGTYVDSDRQTHIYVDNAGTITTFDAPARTTIVLGINNSGEVVGIFADSTGEIQGFTAIVTAGVLLPTITGAASDQATLDTTAIMPFGQVTISDSNSGQTETVTVTPSTTANGVLFDPNAATDHSTVVNGIYTVTGSASAVSTDVNALVFAPTLHQVAAGQTVNTIFTIADADTAGATASNASTSVIVTGTSANISIKSTVSGQTTTDEKTLKPLSGVTIADSVSGQTETVTITLSATANGALSDPRAGTDGSTISSGAYTVTGTAAQVTTDLRALVFTPAAHEVVPGQSVSTTFMISVTDTKGSKAVDSNTSVIATAVSDPPTITGAKAGQTTTDEATITPFANVVIAEVDFGQLETATITPSATGNGVLSDPNAATDGGTVSAGAYSITGTAAAVTTALEGLVFTPTAHQVAPGQKVTTSFTIGVLDTTGATASNTTTTVVATAAKDAPTITGTVPGQTTTDEAADTLFSTVVVSDVDVGQTETVKITPSAKSDGVLSDPNAAADGSTVSSGGAYSITGSAAAVTAALEGLVFTPTAHQVAPGQAVTTGFTIAVKNTAGVTASDTSTGVVAIAVENTPVITGTLASQATTDAAAVKPFATVTIGDADFGQTETVTITPGSTVNGVLSDPHASTDGATIANGVYKVSGTAAAVTKDVAAVVFTPVDHEASPGQSVTTSFTITDTNTAGATASNSTPSVVATATVDPPKITGAKIGQTTTDEATIAPFSKVVIAEVDFGQLETVTVTPGETANGVLSDTNTATDGGTVTAGVYSIIGTAAAVTAAVDGLVFTPTAHQVAPGQKVTTSFTIGVLDTTGATASNTTTTVVATAARDAPTITGTMAGQTTTDANGEKPFTGVTIGEVDHGQIETVTVKPNANANGVLLDWNAAADGSTVSGGVYTVTGSAAAITAAVDALLFTPTLGQVAAGKSVTTTFTISVTDTAGATATNKTTTLVTTADHVVSGTTGNNSLVGITGEDLFDGKGGNDIETGDGGYDTYVFSTGYGTLAINNVSGSSIVPAGQLTLGLGLDQTNMWFMQSGNNLVMDVLGTTESITVNGWFGPNPSAQLAEIVGASGLRIDTDIAQLTDAMAAYQTNNPTFNAVTASAMPTDPTLQSAIAAAWHR